MKKIGKLISIFAASLFLFSLGSCNKKIEKSIAIEEPETPPAMLGRIIVLVVDISQSIKNQLDEIIDGLCVKIVDERLESNDYCVVVPLGDSDNVDRARSFGIKYSVDKDDIKNYLRSMKGWMPTNLNTDIGAAMRKTFQYVNIIEKENDGNMLAPLVLFITDGNIYQSPNSKSKILYDSPDAIFEDPAMDPQKASYENWWFLGIKNGSEALDNIEDIAKRASAYPSRYEILSDMSQFGTLFDKWLEQIPPVKPRDNGRISFSNVRLGNIELSSDSSKYTTVPNSSNLFTWQMRSEYKINTVVMNFTDIKGSFQKDSTGESVEFQIVPEQGNIEFAPGAIRETQGNVKLPAVSGKGKLKLTINTKLNSESDGQIPEYLFFVELKSPVTLVLEKVLPIALTIILIAFAIIITRILKQRRPIRIKIERVGKNSAKPRAASVKINRELEFGSKVGLNLRLEGSNVPPVVGKIIRTGKSNWKIEMESEQWFAPNQKLDPYTLGSSIKLVLKDGSSCSIKFNRIR